MGAVEDVNPAMILRFDVRVINDVVTYRAGEDSRVHMIIVACNDGYVRCFHTQSMLVTKAIKGAAGNALCMDLAGRAEDPITGKLEQRDLLAVGYEDDTFVVYSILQDFAPLVRGKGHRSFVSSISFDNNYVIE